MNLTTKPTLMLVDDEIRIVRALSVLFQARYRVLATTDPRQALTWAEQEDIDVVISDQRMPDIAGVDLLREIRSRSPRTMRLLLTGYADLDAVVASVNEGEIFRFLCKPWNATELRGTVDQAAVIAAAARDASETDAATSETAAILVIDDDESHAVAALGASHRVLHAASLDAAFEQLSKNHVGVILCDLTIRGESTEAALKLLKAEYPELVAVVMTPFRDFNTLIGLINEGQVFRLLPKPVREGLLRLHLDSALRHHQRLRNSTTLRRRHAVVAPTSTDGVMVRRVRGLLSRLRGRDEGAAVRAS